MLPGVEYTVEASTSMHFYYDEQIPIIDLSEAFVTQEMGVDYATVYAYDENMPMYAAFQGLDCTLVFDTQVTFDTRIEDIECDPMRRKITFIRARFSGDSPIGKLVTENPGAVCFDNVDAIREYMLTSRLGDGAIAVLNSTTVDCGVPFERKDPFDAAERSVSPSCRYVGTAVISNIPLLESISELWYSALSTNIEDMDISKGIPSRFVDGRHTSFMDPVDLLIGDISKTDTRTRDEVIRDTYRKWKGKEPARDMEGRAIRDIYSEIADNDIYEPISFFSGIDDMLCEEEMASAVKFEAP